MSKEFNSWQEVIVDFFENRIENIKSSNPKIGCKLYKARKYIDDKKSDIEKLESIKNKTTKDEKKLATAKNSIKEKNKELTQLRKDAPSTEIRDWLEKNYSKTVKDGNETIKATHVLKFTHSSSNPGGLLFEEKSNDLLLSTASLKRKLILDLAHKDGAHISISRFFGLELNDKLIIDCILQDDFKFLNPFKKNNKQFNGWKDGFSNMVKIREMKTADKAKQLYFPINNSVENYHLITPLFASSLCNEVDTMISNLKYKEKKEINKYRNHKKDNKKSPQYHQSLYTDYPNLAVQNFGGKHAKNVSMLNANRSGKAYLFSTQPPTWQSKLKPPTNKKSMFDTYRYSLNTSDNIKFLVEFLLRNENIDLSVRDPEKQKWLEKWTAYIVDDFWFFVGNIHTLPSGWSKDSKLKPEHRYLLDPYKKDKEFQTSRKNADWQKIVINDFSSWLNKQLKGKDKKFTPQKEYSRTWKKVIKKELREYNQIIEVGIDMEVGI